MFTMRDYLVESERRKSEIAEAEAARLRKAVTQPAGLRSTVFRERVVAHLAMRLSVVRHPSGSVHGAVGEALT